MLSVTIFTPRAKDLNVAVEEALGVIVSRAKGATQCIHSVPLLDEVNAECNGCRAEVGNSIVLAGTECC